MTRLTLLVLPLGALLLSGCVTSVVSSAVTAPFKVAGKTIDVLTTSQDEADLNRGRAARKAEDEQRKADKRARKEAERERKDEERARRDD